MVTKRSGFTLVELGTVIGVMITLSLVVITSVSRFIWMNREAQLREELRLVRAAMERAYADTGWYPLPSDLDKKIPGSGTRPVGGQPMFGSYWRTTPQIPISRWQGPYLDHPAADPVRGGVGFCYSSYSTASGNFVSSCYPPYDKW